MAISIGYSVAIRRNSVYFIKFNKLINILKTAYPNYFIDISEFLNVLRTVILNYSQYNKSIESFINSNYILEDYIPVG